MKLLHSILNREIAFPKKKTVLWPLCLAIFCSTFLSPKLFASTADPFAILVEINHVCGNELGSATFELTGDPSCYTYYWEHGPTTLSIHDLQPGIYTFVVTDKHGCVEVYEVEILAFEECTMISGIYPTFNPCVVIISITVFSGGVPVDESALNIVWSDGNPSGLRRFVGLDQSNTYCVTITSIQGGDCCSLYECFPIQAVPECRFRERVIVNEFNRKSDGSGQFLELLVLGDGNCEATFDIRGFHIDDNNGMLIPGNDYINGTNLENIGINPGFMSFSFQDSWAAVPNGSLILIYSSTMQGFDGYTMPAFDPQDSNGDKVYVVAAEDPNYLHARTGGWDILTDQMDYTSGYIIPPSWDLINISPNGDGMQVRNPDGTYSHGVSLGQSAFSVENHFELWVSPNNSSECNCRLTLTDYLDKTHWDCDSSPQDYLVTQTPGAANSAENAALIAELTDCLLGNPEGGRFQLFNSTNTNGLSVYPNPFDGSFTLSFDASMEGEATVMIYSIAGQQYMSRVIDCTEGKNTWTLDTANKVPTGTVILQLEYPSGEKEHIRIVRADSR